MLDFNIRVTSGTDNDAVALKNCLVEWDDVFEEESPSLCIEVEDLYGHADDMDEMDKLAISIAKALPASEFLVYGRIDTSESAGEYMDFSIEYKNQKLISKHSSWYVYMWADDFAEYEDFAENYQDKKGKPRYTKEQFEAFRKTQHFVLKSGAGACVPQVPLEYERELDVERQAVCPICGEALHQGVPICKDKTGMQYHIWCAEDAQLKVEII